VNPAFVVLGWGDAPPRIRVNGKWLRWSEDARYGIVSSPEADELVVWLRVSARTRTTVQIEPGPN
jgi:hypothetical protein